jgi:anti-sigma factor RsiW
MIRRLRCWLARRDLTALVDQELPSWRSGRVSRHIQRCARCASLYAEIRDGVESQHDVLNQAMRTFPPTDVVRMLGAVRGRLVERAEASRYRVWQPTAVGALAVAALAVFFLVRDVERQSVRARAVSPGGIAKGAGAIPGVRGPGGADVPAGEKRLSENLAQPEALAREDWRPDAPRKTSAEPLVQHPPEEVPPELLAKPDLFVDYGMMVRLDALENFDHVQSLLDTDGSGTQQAG